MFLAAHLLACGVPVIGMRVRAEFTCEAPGETPCAEPMVGTPCRCYPHQFYRESGTVEVVEGRYDPDATVVFTVEYDSELETCGSDHVVTRGPSDVYSGLGTALYQVDPEASFYVLDRESLVAETADELQFEYLGDDGSLYREVHTVEFRDAMIMAPYAASYPCCAVTGGAVPPLSLVIAAGAALALRHRPR